MLKLSTIPQVFFHLPVTNLTPLGPQLESDIWRHEQILTFRSSGAPLVATFGCMWLGHQQIQGPRAWIICETPGSYLVRLTCSNCIVDWAQTFAEVTNVSNCWICTTLPGAVADGLPWHKHSASAEKWTWLETLIPMADTWNATRQAADKGCCKTHGMPGP
ncbi:uncharacterized protein LOC112626731 [Theropithecus gelada]|uniref:uncharacterized protein LOC112626731 n=1 Tax=Theropithecus gelada TaxID=9565 RepID=UPI000DC1AEA0|nr:uncharacterized protein LOC112626731 [Theropithecus gelada]